MSKLHIPVDTQVIMIAHNMSDIECQDCHVQLMDAFGKNNDVCLALDNGGLVLQEYRDKMGGESAGAQWVLSIIRNGIYTKHDLGTIPRQLKVKLDNEGFHKTDRKFVRLGMSTPSKCLVAEEKIYGRPQIRKILRGHVTICTSSEACEMIKANLPCGCCV